MTNVHPQKLLRFSDATLPSYCGYARCKMNLQHTQWLNVWCWFHDLGPVDFWVPLPGPPSVRPPFTQSGPHFRSLGVFSWKCGRCSWPPKVRAWEPLAAPKVSRYDPKEPKRARGGEEKKREHLRGPGEGRSGWSTRGRSKEGHPEINRTHIVKRGFDNQAAWTIWYNSAMSR